MSQLAISFPFQAPCRQLRLACPRSAHTMMSPPQCSPPPYFADSAALTSYANNAIYASLRGRSFSPL